MNAMRWGGVACACATAIAFACNGKEQSPGGNDGGPGGVPVTRSAPSPRDIVPVPTSPSKAVEAPLTGTGQVLVHPDGGAATCPGDMVDCGNIGSDRACCPAGMTCRSNGAHLACYPACPADHPERCVHVDSIGYPAFTAAEASCCFSGGCQKVEGSPSQITYACRCPKDLPTQLGSSCSPACPADHPNVCGTECCSPGASCEDSPGSARSCGCAAGSQKCGDGCCAEGQTCLGTECGSCPADHPVDCGSYCCPQNSLCINDGCAVTSGRYP